MKLISKFLMIALIPAFLASCAKDLSSNTYVDSSTAGIVYEGTIVSSRIVTVKDTDKLGERPGLGALGGGVAGGIGASNIGKGKGSAAATVGGALAGALIGNLIEDKLKTGQGIEYIVKLSDDSVFDDSKDIRKTTIGGSRSVSQQITGSTKMGLKSRVISVVQGTDTSFSTGQHVYVIFNDNRPRIVAAN